MAKYIKKDFRDTKCLMHAIVLPVDCGWEVPMIQNDSFNEFDLVPQQSGSAQYSICFLFATQCGLQHGRLPTLGSLYGRVSYGCESISACDLGLMLGNSLSESNTRRR